MDGVGALDSLGAVAEEAAELLGSTGSGSVVAYEGMLEALVRWCGRDRAGLGAALQPVLERYDHFRPRSNAGRRLLDVMRSAAGPVGPVLPGPAAGDGRGRWLETCQHEAVELVLGTRTGELAVRLRHGDVPPMLLATAGRESGALDAYELVMRLTEYEQAGARPGPADLGQALLRCGGGPADPEVVRAAEELTLPEGPRVAAWLRAGGLPQPGWSREQEPGAPEPPSRRRGARVGRRVLVGTGALDGRGEFPRTFWPLFRPFEPLIGCNHLLLDHRERHAAAALPWHPEIVAARLLTEVAAGTDQGGADGPEFLPALAGAAGPPGPAVHLALAYGLASAHAADREAAVRALLDLAAGGRLDGELLGREIAALVLLGTAGLPVVTASLAAAAGPPGAPPGTPGGVVAAGAVAVWPVLAAALEPLLAALRTGTLRRAHPALLELAADCAQRCAARGPIAEVTALAQRPGSAQSVRAARRLRDLLAGA
ncbi:hypothetical protein DEJ50_04245 [Streptomyces venezuelae]|uniref:Uncharacterized protein n=1 Tax=Streptomyces venezuelae TaxID=54571 RepID=A0A5P2CZH8_STRVZ|nr:hypothetical protein [Streptomyces venezuelae]QES47168.1 hypothetical protein DEJ50_04245 [Streptomyces venezuelae]